MGKEKRKRPGFAFRAAGSAVMLLLSLLCCSLAAAAGEHAETGSLTILYYDSADGKEPVAGAEFTCMRIGIPVFEGSGGKLVSRYEPVIGSGKSAVDVNSDINADEIAPFVARAYQGTVPPGGRKYAGKTGKNGRLHLKGLEPGAYLVTETSPAKDHLASAPFVFAIPHTTRSPGSMAGIVSYDAEAEPKPVPCGRLVITKTVRGNGGDQSRSFRFRVTLGAEGSFHYRRSDGTEGMIASGKEITLSHGQSVVIENIPVGVSYEVSETDADSGGYRTDSTGASGRIRKKTESTAAFVNTKYRDVKKESGGGGFNPVLPVRTGDVSGILPFSAAALLSIAAVIMAVKRKRGGENL